MLLRALEGHQVVIILLQMATWTKWLLMAILILMIGRFLITTGRVLDKMLGVACYAPFVVGCVAIFKGGPLTEVFARLFFLLFPLLILYTFFPGIRRNSDAIQT